MNRALLGHSPLKSFMWLQSDDSQGCGHRKSLLGCPRWVIHSHAWHLMLAAHWELSWGFYQIPTQGIFMWLGLLMGKWSRAVTFLTCSLASKREHPKMSIPRNLGGSYKFSCNLNPRSCSISSLVFYWSKATYADSPGLKGRRLLLGAQWQIKINPCEESIREIYTLRSTRLSDSLDSLRTTPNIIKKILGPKLK